MASTSRSQISVQRRLDCPGCGEELNGNVPELPCGHCVCRSCAKELESQSVQKCAMMNCASNRNAFEQRIKFSNLPQRSVVDIENNSMGLPPPYQATCCTLVSLVHLLYADFNAVFTGNSITRDTDRASGSGATAGASETSGLSSSSDGSRTRAEDKKRELVGFRVTGKIDQSITCIKAAYDSNTRELFAKIVFDDENFGGITVFGVSGDQNDQLQVKRTMKWKTLRGDKTGLLEICLDTTSNSLYGVVLQEGNFKVEELDKLTLKKKSELDTEGLLSGENIYWFLTSKSDTIILTVFDERYKDNHKWHSVTMYKNKTRLYTVLLDMKTDVDNLSCFGCALITETTLLLICGGQDSKVALVSLPAQTQQHHTHASASSTPSSSTEPP
ncbi:uncharacterized protein LOC134856165, partial [Symsagittifera roscoffensis]|uniref:uncharacterized protein LOC134856165 n=1 Tax=Symsagittifera roscoffensis TaxID=84072 RepID=UPI00307C24DD